MKAIQIEAFGKSTEVVNVVDPGGRFGDRPAPSKGRSVSRADDPISDLPRVEAVMDKQVRFETSGALGILTLVNPPLNLFGEELIEDLRGAVTAAKQTPLRGLMVRAEGKIFSGGADVRMFKGRTSAHARERVTSHLRTIADLEELPCPTVAAVQGLCLAAGLELALACDLIWAGASARFAQAEASIGTTTLLGGVQRLAERAGPSRAREIIYTADQYDAATFERWNIVNRIVPDDALEAETRAFAARLANGPTLAYAAGKRIVRAYLDGSVRGADKVVDEVGPPLFESKDMQAGVTALLDHGPRGFRDKVVFEGR